MAVVDEAEAAATATRELVRAGFPPEAVTVLRGDEDADRIDSLGKVGGGWMSSRLMKQGWTLDRARKVVMLISALSMAASLPAIVAPTPLGFVLFISLATFGHGSWATTTQTIPGDIVAPRFVGTVYGITAFGGGIGAIIFTYVTGKLVDTYGSFTGPFVVAALLPLVAYAAFALVAGQIRPVQFEEAAATHGSRS